MGGARPRLLIAGGVDSSGRAGLDADRDAIDDAGASAVYVATARTEQDDAGVHAVHEVEDWWREATDEAARGVDGAKLGLLPTVRSIERAAELCARLARDGRAVVVDPVAGASSGEPFWGREELEAFRSRVAPARAVLTPNVPELAALEGRDPSGLAADPDARLDAARALLDRGARAVVVTGGHAEGEAVLDLALDRGREPIWVERRRRPGAGIRGSGCRFATRLGVELARGAGLAEAVQAAGDLVARRIDAARD